MTRALGRYELLRPLARGGMAEVYLARRRSAGVEKWLVVKRMRPERTGDPRFLDLFVREARLSMSLVHQNIVPVFDFGRIDDQVFLAMERVEGKDLGSSLARAPTHRMPALLAAFVAAECCQALDYAHQRKGPDGVALGIVHRDVTPRNVLLSWSGEVKLTDFGIAALAGEATARLLGTPQYMAPEQARGEPIDPRTDIYAIGLVLREAISGARPRPGGDRETILGAARSGALLPWAHLADGLPAPAEPAELALGSGDHGPSPGATRDEPPPPALVAIIDRATAAAPGDRYPDARSMLEDLDTFIVGQRAAHKAESPARQLAAWLASVWGGIRDELDSDSAIDAEHLVSFLDDGAPDVVGTGTVRSMLATAADDALAAAEPGSAPAVAAGEPGPASDASAGPAGLDAARLTRISSSTSRVASGSFDAHPAGGDRARSPARASGGVRGGLRLAGLALAATASAAIVLVVAQDRAARPPDAAPPDPPSTLGAAPPGAAPPSAAPPSAAPPSVPAAAPPTVAAPSAPSAIIPAAASTGLPAAASPPEHAVTRHAGSGPSMLGHPAPRPPNARPPGSAPPAVAADQDPDRARPALCRVRINLTPWAYYTADADTTRHETPSTIDLAPGPHRLHVWNPELQVERDITITVPADRETMSYSEPLQPSTLPPDAHPPP